MNEHDSERIAGLLEADGLVADRRRRRRRRRGAQHVLHPGERRQQALRHPRPPEVGQGPRARTCRSSWPAAWPRRTGTGHPGAGAATSTWCSAPTTCTGPPSCCTQSRRRGPLDRRDPRGDGARRPRRVPLGAAGAARGAGYAAWVTIQIGCDNSCAFCIVPGGAGPGDQPAVRRHRRRGRAAGRRRRHRGHAARPEREQLRPRPRPRRPPGRRRRRGCARCSPSCCGRSARSTGIRRVRYTSPHPKDLRPETIAAMAETPEVCEHLHLPLQSGSDRVLAAMHRGYTAERYLERLAAARAAIADLAVTTDIIVGLPRRDRRRLRAHPRGGGRGRLRQRLHVHLHAPAGHRGGRAGRRLRRPRGGRPSASTASRSSSSARRWPGTRPASAGSRRSLVEGPSRKDPAVLTGRTRQNKLVHFASRRRSGPAPTPRCGSPAPRPTTCAATWSRSPPGAAHKTRLPLLVG